MIDILTGDARAVLPTLPDGHFHTCVTSPPYFGLRDYGNPAQMGLEQTPAEYVAAMVDVFREVRRVLRPDGTLWLNLGDSYASIGGVGQGRHWDGRKKNTETQSLRRAPSGEIKPKDLIGIPWRVAFALQADGWYLRQDIVWHKPNPMPESVTDRCTKAHEYLFLLTKSERYYFDHKAIAEPADPKNHRDSRGLRPTPPGQTPTTGFKDGRHYETRNRRSVWTVPTRPFQGAHFATFPPELIRPCILAGSPKGGIVLDPFGGAGTTGLVAKQEGRDATLIELNPDYAAMARARTDAEEVQEEMF
jgi:DNA modification methylase